MVDMQLKLIDKRIYFGSFSCIGCRRIPQPKTGLSQFECKKASILCDIAKNRLNGFVCFRPFDHSANTFSRYLGDRLEVLTSGRFGELDENVLSIAPVFLIQSKHCLRSRSAARKKVQHGQVFIARYLEQSFQKCDWLRKLYEYFIIEQLTEISRPMLCVDTIDYGEGFCPPFFPINSNQILLVA